MFIVLLGLCQYTTNYKLHSHFLLRFTTGTCTTGISTISIWIIHHVYKQRSSFSTQIHKKTLKYQLPSFWAPGQRCGGIDYRLMSGMRRLDTSAFDTSPPVCVQTKDICIKPSCGPDPLHNSCLLNSLVLTDWSTCSGHATLCSLSLEVMSPEALRT